MLYFKNQFNRGNHRELDQLLHQSDLQETGPPHCLARCKQASTALRRPWAQCVGVMDGTVVPLAYQPSSEDKGNFWNYKRFYGLAVFAVCNIHKNFQLINLSFCGSPHDSRMFKDTLLYTNAKRHFSSGEWVMGDAAFAQSEYVVGPYKLQPRQGVLPKEKAKFNFHFARTRIAIKHCFGQLKNRFSSLKSLRVRINGRSDLVQAWRWIHACMLLHNFLN